jgi:hypothetical protein
MGGRREARRRRLEGDARFVEYCLLFFGGQFRPSISVPRIFQHIFCYDVPPNQRESR